MPAVALANMATLASPSLELTIVILCRNEERAISHCVGQAVGFLNRKSINGEVVVVDNGSEDGSAALAQEAGARVVSEPRAGYGNAIKTGLESAQGEFIILGDGDGEHDLSALDQFHEKLREGFDFVVGNRFQGGFDPDSNPLLNRYIGTPLLSGIGKLFFRAPVGDFNCGLRGFSAAAARAVAPQSAGMEASSEMIVKAIHRKLRIAEVPIVQRRAADPDRISHMRPFRDGWRHLRLLLMLSPKWLFLYPAWLLLAAGALAMAFPIINPVERGGLFGAYTMLFGGAFLVLGAQLVGIYLSARAFYETSGLIEGNLNARLRENNVLETWLAAGILLALAGAAVAAWSLFVWAGGGEVAFRLRLLIAAVTMMILGVQTMFHGFLISLLAAQAARR